MKLRILVASCVCFTALNGLPLSAQESEPLRVVEPGSLHVRSDRDAAEALGRAQATIGDTAPAALPNAASSGFPVWSYSVKASQNGSTYSGQIVGTSPLTTTSTTVVPSVLIPVVVQITQGGRTYTFDPTATDPGCIGSGNTAFRLTAASPLFVNSAYSMNGVNVGTTQYGDANLRGEFWKYVAGTGYHLLLSSSSGPRLTITVNAGTAGNSTAEVYSVGSGQCGSNTGSVNVPATLGVVNINTVDAMLQHYISANGLTASQFPFFVLYNTVISDGAANNLNDCCILGYHNALGNPGQTYGIAEFEGRDQTVFSGVSDVAAASHEVNEWINDPFGSNPTPAWGNVGQVSGCQANLEVGDPLSGTLRPTVTLSNGFTYHLQELAFFSWFYGGSLGAGGLDSNNGSFRGSAILCPPGGTH